MSTFSPIHHTFGPHVDGEYLRRTLLLSYKPHLYCAGPDREKLHHALRDRFGMQSALFASGRESLLALLKAFDLPARSEVIVQGFTCVVLPNAIHAAGLKTVYADIDEDTLNLTPDTVEAVATPLTRVVICQHTFGIPSPVEELRSLCDKNGWILIEDCAHVLPDRQGPTSMLRYSDHAILSFGRDKAISGIGGGAALSKDPVVAEKLRVLEEKASEVSWWDVVRLLEYPPRMAHIVRPLIGLKLATPLLALQKALRLFVPVLTSEEKRGHMSTKLHRLPNACAALAVWQLSKLEQINDHRRTLTKRYLQASADHGWSVLHGIGGDLPLWKFPMFVRDAGSIRRTLLKDNIHLNDGWTSCVVCPENCDIDATGYKSGKDPHAERASKELLSLPTHPTMTDAQARALIAALTPLLRS